MKKRVWANSLLVCLVSVLWIAPGCSGCGEEDPIEEPDAGEVDTGDDVHQEPDAEPDADNQSESTVFDVLDETERWQMPNLSGPVYVVRTEGNIPHIYGANDADVARVHGFVAARDRFFMMDMARRLALGTITEVLGDAALDADVQQRMSGSRYVSHRLLETATPEDVEIFEAYAEGVNHYIAQAAAGRVPYPSEVDLFWQLLGLSDPGDMLAPFEALDVAAIFATFIYNSSFSRSAIGRTANYQALQGLFDGARFGELRQAGAEQDIWAAAYPIYFISSGEWGPIDRLPSTGRLAMPDGNREIPRAPTDLLERLDSSLKGQELRMGWRGDDDQSFGSNAWAVSGDHTPDGASLLAGDGHLALGIPSILYSVGLDTSVLGDDSEALPKLGLVIPGMPYMGQGTNGHVAWASTQLFGDVTDYYVEEIELDSDGLPATALFEGTFEDLVAVDEIYDIAGVALLGSAERQETWTRWETFDGRWIVDIEGTPVGPDHEPGPGQSVVRTHSGWVVPGDTTGDGTITAVSMAFAGLQVDNLGAAFKGMAESRDIVEFREFGKGLQASSFNFAVSDSQGNIYYSSFQATPCRDYLPREGDGFEEGADPTMLLDGTRFGNFIIPTTDGVVDDSQSEDPYRCVVPFDVFPHDYNPDRGFVMTANNDPADVSFDGNLFSGPYYIGGPWYPGWRAELIHRGLEEAIAEDRADVDAMADLQGNVESPLGRDFTPYLFGALDLAEDLYGAGGALPGWEGRLLADYGEHRDELLDVYDRLQGWADRGFQARSGVETFYNSPSADDRADAVATMIFNAYLRALVRLVLHDEGFPGIWQRGGTAGRLRLLYDMLEGRGEDNPRNLASFNPDTEESIFFDDINTDDVERSDELMVRALIEALEYLKSEPIGNFRGGFGHDDKDEWLWGLRHQVRFESLLASFLGDDPLLAGIIGQFSINTDRLPLADDLPQDDPRRVLDWFPRDGDQYNVDASNAGISGDDFTYSNGPVMRMVIALRDGEVWGQNIIPGGQSGLTASEHFDDQAALWLGNQALPIRFHVEEVIEHAVGLEVYEP